MNIFENVRIAPLSQTRVERKKKEVVESKGRRGRSGDARFFFRVNPRAFVLGPGAWIEAGAGNGGGPAATARCNREVPVAAALVSFAHSRGFVWEIVELFKSLPLFQKKKGMP